MPATFEGFGLKLLYPDNWTIVPRDKDEGDQGVTLDVPGGGFLSLETIPITRDDETLIAEIDAMIREQYDDVELEDVELPNATEGERTVDFRFVYLDLIIVSRLTLIDPPPSTRDQMPIAGRILIQFQAESRDFDANELVLDAILKQIRDMHE